MNTQWLKDNWFLIVFSVSAFAGYVEWRVKENTSAEVSAIKAVSPQEIAAMNDKINDNKRYIEKTEDKVERIVAILLEE